MSTKLTLSIDSDVIEKAKQYAKKHRRSLSNIVEDYLKAISGSKEKEEIDELDPDVKALWNSVKIPDDKDYKELLQDSLIEKYLKDE